MEKSGSSMNDPDFLVGIEKRRQERAAAQEAGMIGIELARQIAKDHENELKQIIQDNNGEIPLELITDGAVTANTLLDEFERLARERNLDLNKIYNSMGSITYGSGHRFEFLAFLQIVMAGRNKQSQS